jgi:SAM-dependent methyltransferase
MQPLANRYLKADELTSMEPFYPLHLYICDGCLLVQTEAVVTAHDIFSDYAYFSSYSDSWLQHARSYAETAAKRFALHRRSLVIELGSNDGYLLQYFVAEGIPVLGVEPAANVAQAAVARGIPTRIAFFGRETARELAAESGQADLLVANNVLAHVPDLNDFVAGLKMLLKPQGVITAEFPHLLRLMAENQFDTIYHEHFSYFSFTTVERVFQEHGLTLFDVDEIPTHGGSLRIYAGHREDSGKTMKARGRELKGREHAAGLTALNGYLSFAEQVRETKRKFLDFLISSKRGGKTIVGYGAPAKGNTLLNYCGVRSDFIDYTVDRSPHKQGRFLPGSHIPIHHPDMIQKTKPDYLLLFPWNIKDEIMEQMAGIRGWGGRFVAPIPEVTILS